MLIPNEPFSLQVVFQGFIISLAMGVLAYFLKTISISGVIGGVIFGTIIYSATGLAGFIIPLSFFIIGTLATKHGYRKKLEMGIAQEEGGRRGAKHALANILAGTIFAVMFAIFINILEFSFFFFIAMIGSFATAAADTTSSEMGQVYGKKPINPLTFKSVPPGTEGAISKEGTLWGILASAIIAITGIAFWLKSWSISESLIGFLSICIGAFIGNMLESLIGAAGGKRLNNEVLNFLNTLIGGFVSGALFLIFMNILDIVLYS